MRKPNVEDLGTRLLRLKQQLDEQKQERSQLQGEQRSLLNQLKAEFGVDTLEDAQALLEQETAALKDMELNLLARIEELEEAMAE